MNTEWKSDLNCYRIRVETTEPVLSWARRRSPYRQPVKSIEPIVVAKNQQEAVERALEIGAKIMHCSVQVTRIDIKCVAFTHNHGRDE